MSMDDFIPKGFSPLADWDHRHRGNNDGHSLEWKTLSDAVKAGKIPGFKLSNGRWYVHDQKANDFLAKASEPASDPVANVARKGSADPALADSRIESAVVALCRIDNGISLVYATLERMTSAIESLVTHPRFEQYEQQLRREIGVNCESTNGFHN